jgi:hypothetical protein
LTAVQTWANGTFTTPTAVNTQIGTYVSNWAPTATVGNANKLGNTLASDYPQWIQLATVASSGSYNDLGSKPTLGTMAAETATDYVTHSYLTSWKENALDATYAPISHTHGSFSGTVSSPTVIVISNGIVTNCY